MPDKPLFLTKLFNLYVYSQPLEVWADRTNLLPEEKAHTWTLKGGRNASIKGNESQKKREKKRERGPKSRASHLPSRRKNSRGENTLTMYAHHHKKSPAG